ncbi:uncharacterized protein BDR25DRAFT_391625 [Lindgomyces ingoldianus]|uniref:Uncharacterized protein n=1 Tax=Lindgomyces ingoldianus TaxID=673940 RepID=A0ACB6R8E9_9PLEO|nr:uncharacterized protein BDR25DRAFT_391625 [Lindgomyces ingoldianus]KAF2475593.1 hypothetical protein BDR25DRAFT_391625 [Lindgomyces ingoldianus]
MFSHAEILYFQGFPLLVNETPIRHAGQGLSHQAFAQLFSYSIAGGLIFTYFYRRLVLCKRPFQYLWRCQFILKVINHLHQISSLPLRALQAVSYLRFHISSQPSSLNPPPLNRMIFLLFYWSFLAFLSTYKAFIDDASYSERAGYRFGWVAAAQMPLVYATASKRSLPGYLLGLSHERLNWFHRWASRTFTVFVCVHGALLSAEHVNAGLFKLELQLMPMLRYGLGAGGVLLWTFSSSVSIFRTLGYRFFVFQHSASAAIFLCLVYKHLVSSARTYAWPAIGLFTADWAIRLILFCYHSINLNAAKLAFGLCSELMSVGSDIIVLTLRDYKHSWKPGQYFYVWIPTLGPLETHPYTCSRVYSPSDAESGSDLQFVIQGRNGFAKRLQEHALSYRESHDQRFLRAFVSGPYGTYPKWDSYQTLVFISASTGTSFTLPTLESLIHNFDHIATCRIRCLVVTPNLARLEPYLARLCDAATLAKTQHFDFRFQVAVTESTQDEEQSAQSGERRYNAIEGEQYEVVAGGDSREFPSPDQCSFLSRSSLPSPEFADEFSLLSHGPVTIPTSIELEDFERESKTSEAVLITGRPNIREYISHAVRKEEGNCMVAVCAGSALVAATSNAVALLALRQIIWGNNTKQRIYLHAEEFSL